MTSPNPSADVTTIVTSVERMIAAKTVDPSDALGIALAVIDLAVAASSSVAETVKAALAALAASPTIASKLSPEVVAAIQHLSASGAIDDLVARIRTVPEPACLTKCLAKRFPCLGRTA